MHKHTHRTNYKHDSFRIISWLHTKVNAHVFGEAAMPNTPIYHDTQGLCGSSGEERNTKGNDEERAGGNNMSAKKGEAKAREKGLVLLSWPVSIELARALYRDTEILACTSRTLNLGGHDLARCTQISTLC